MTTFIGRTEELTQLRGYFDAGRRLVSVLGPPGTGKTRTIGEHRTAIDALEVPTWFVDLSATRNAREVLAAVAAALEVGLEPGDDFDESVVTVSSALQGEGPALLVLDNFEQVVDAAPATLGVWMRDCPETHFVVGSRHRLDLPDEYVFELGPLPLGDAVDLFVDRARMIRRDFERTPQNTAAIEQLVTRLDRLPLAIELAAARIATLSPADLLVRLDARFKLLRTRERGVDPRQATLEAAIAWSWDLLSETERSALTQCSIFVGGFTLEAAEAVVELDDEWTLDALDALRAKSLIATTSSADGSRFVVYESIRDFARAQADDGEVARRHAEYFAQFGERHAEAMHGRGGNTSMRALERESPNLLAVFRAATTHDAALALRVAATLDQLLRFVGPSELHEELLEDAVELATTGGEPTDLARFLRARAELLALQGRLDDALVELDEAERDADELERGWIALRRGEILRTKGDAAAGAEVLADAIDVGREHGVLRLERTALGHRANCFVDAGDLDAARAALVDLGRTRRSADLRGECELLKRTAYVQYYLGNYAEQRRQNEEALELATEIGDRRLEGLCLQGIGDSAFALGDFEGAVDFYARGLAIHQALGNLHYEAMLLGNLGGAYHRSAQLARARKCYARSLELHRQTGARPYEGVVSFALGALEHESGNADDAHFHYDRALDIARETHQPSDVGALMLCKAWVDLESPNFAAEALGARVDAAKEQLAELDGCWDAVAHATAGLVATLTGTKSAAHFAAARKALDDDAKTEQAIVELFEGGDATTDEDVFRRSLHARLARRLVEISRRNARVGDLDEVSEVSVGPTVTIGPDVRWFQFPDAERVDLRRRKALRLVLQHLLEMHDTEPGHGSDVHEVFDAGWPDEEIHPDQAVERVYWAVRTLRKLGFEDTLLTSDEGYHLHHQLEVTQA